jgi:MoaA/NifB/PqqE/SkfB family radical SAM enzyme
MKSNEKIEERNKRKPLETVVPLSTPYVIYMDPCGACNFGCNFCPCNNSSFMNKERFKMMSLDLFKKIVDDMCTFDEQVKVVDLWAWGEPFMNKKLLDMIKYLNEKKACREIRTCTNGSFLKPELNQRLVNSGLDMIRISISALDAEGYEETCKFKIDYDEYVNNIRDLFKRSRGTRTKVSIKAVELAVNTEEKVNKFYEFFSPICDYVFIEDIVDAFPGYDGLEKPDNTKITFRKWNAYSDRANYVCAKPLVQMAIHSNGAVSACCNDWKFKTAYGNVATERLKDLWLSEHLNNFRLLHLEKDREEIPYCNICDCESDDDIDDVRDIIAQNIRKSMQE